MTFTGLGALLLIAAGAFLQLPVLAILGIVVGAVEVVHATWSQRGLADVRYERQLAGVRVPWGEEIPMTVEVWNRKRLPLAWLRADDATSDGVEVRGRELVEDEEKGFALRNTWTLRPFEKVRRRVWVSAARRGVFSIGPAELVVGDLFARDAARAQVGGTDRFTVWPRVVAAPGVARSQRWGDLDRAHAGLIEDPARFAGVRTYSPGDPLRRIHARTSARLGRPVTKRFEPARERQVLIALDIQTMPGGSWDLAHGDDVEALYVIAASLVHALSAEGAAFGLTAAGYTRTPTRFADVPVGRGQGQEARVLDVLARLSPYPSASFEVLLARISRRVSRETGVLVVTMRDPSSFFEQLRRLRRAGFSVSLLACGPAAASDALRARSAGFAARAAQLNGPWRTATRLATTA